MRRARRGLTLLTMIGVVLVTAGWMPAPTIAKTDAIRGYEYWLDEYGITDAWQTTQGEGITVAVIDTGVDGSVDDLAGAVTGGTDVSGIGASNGQKPIGKESGHGTWVASLLAGRGHTESTNPPSASPNPTSTSGTDENVAEQRPSGLVGVAPEASLLSISVGLGEHATERSSDEQIADAVRWAVDHGADVINMSLTRNTRSWPTSWDDAFSYAFDHDVVVVAAAGNRGSGTNEVGAPATIPGVLTVAGVDREGKASFDASSQGITIAVAAPSEQLIGANPGKGYVHWEGTSGAAPIVSGIVALVRAAHPDLDADNVINRIISTATPPPDGEVPSPIYGYGLVNADKAVTADVAQVASNPMGDLHEWIHVHRYAEPTDEPTVEPYPVPAATATPIPAEDFTSAERPTFTWHVLTARVIPLSLLGGILLIVAFGVVALVRSFNHRREKE